MFLFFCFAQENGRDISYKSSLKEMNLHEISDKTCFSEMEKWSEMSFVIIKHLAFSADAIFEIHISQKIGFDIANYL